MLCVFQTSTLEASIFSINHFMLHGAFGGEIIRMQNPPNDSLLWEWEGCVQSLHPLNSWKRKPCTGLPLELWGQLNHCHVNILLALTLKER